MKYKLYQVDAFTQCRDKDRLVPALFTGNPAAVCPLENWLSDDLMQKIAMENNLAETAFYVKDGDRYLLRWFTPKVEVDLCGHATLAAAFVLFNHENHIGNRIDFYSERSGLLTVSKEGNLLTLDFPADVIKQVAISEDMNRCFNIFPVEAYKGKTDLLLVFESESQIRSIVPDFNLLAKLDFRGVIVTAKGDDVDFVSRFFAPQVGINEDPVTGSAHTTLTPYWSKRMEKDQLTAMQLSERGGYLECAISGERVSIKGQGKLYLTGEIFID